MLVRILTAVAILFSCGAAPAIAQSAQIPASQPAAQRPARRSGTRGRHRTNGGRPRSGRKRQRHVEVQRHAAHRRSHERPRRGCEISGGAGRGRHCTGQLLPLQRRQRRARERPHRHLALSSRQRMAGRRRLLMFAIQSDNVALANTVLSRKVTRENIETAIERSGAHEETRVRSCSESIARRIAGSTGLHRRRRDT